MIVTSLALFAATLGAVTGVAADAPGASAVQVTRIAVRYACQFPSGRYPVSFELTGTAKATGTAGSPIQPSAVRLAAQLPSGSGLRKPGTATGSLTVVEASQSKSARVAWRLRGSTASGTLALAATVPPVIGSGSGPVTFAASGLAVNLPFGKATVQVACAINRPVRFAAVTVSAAKPVAKSAGRSKFPKGCGHIKVVGSGEPTCAYVTGYSDVAKLIGAALLQPRLGKPGLVNVAFAEIHKFKHNDLIETSAAQLLYRGHRELPPVTATFLGFRFVPVTATLHLTELTTIAIYSDSGVSAPPYPIFVRTKTKVSVHVTNVRVNGVPLNVGPDCRTVSPLTLVLIGRGFNTLPPKGYTVPTGGPLSGEVTIPAFTGCGVTENLDALFTGSISGRGNFVKVTQGKLCGPLHPANWFCPPPIPKAQR